MKHLVVCSMLAVCGNACDQTATIPATPAAPVVAAPAPPVPRVPHTLSGVVFEIVPEGRRPVHNVDVYCDGCGSEVGHTRVFTDPDGVYSFEWTYDGVNRLLISKDGYRVANPTATSGALEFKDAMVSGDTRFDIEMARR
jgi:hypothetical protein